MTSHHEIQHSPYTPEQLYTLVADVERYPEFLPWCRAARVFEQDDKKMVAELVISFKHITEQYTSEITLDKPNEIHVKMIRGPFSHLTNDWKFLAREDGGTDIDFSLDFKFKSIILDKLIGAFFTRATHKMVEAFKKRADALYGGENNDNI